MVTNLVGFAKISCYNFSMVSSLENQQQNFLNNAEDPDSAWDLFDALGEEVAEFVMINPQVSEVELLTGEETRFGTYAELYFNMTYGPENNQQTTRFELDLYGYEGDQPKVGIHFFDPQGNFGDNASERFYNRSHFNVRNPQFRALKTFTNDLITAINPNTIVIAMPKDDRTNKFYKMLLQPASNARGGNLRIQYMDLTEEQESTMMTAADLMRRMAAGEAIPKEELIAVLGFDPNEEEEV